MNQLQNWGSALSQDVRDLGQDLWQHVLGYCSCCLAADDNDDDDNDDDDDVDDDDVVSVVALGTHA